jgi:DNA-binding HxlR family transcriptional regulator
MERKSFSDMDCSIAQCLEVVGEWWSLLIVRDAFLGVRRFDDFQAHLGISRNVLHQRLAHLVEFGILEKVPYSTRPPRSEYRLTDAGRDLWPVLASLRRWGDRHAAPNGPPLVFIHRACGRPSQIETVCSSCHGPISAGEADVAAGEDRDLEAMLPRAMTERGTTRGELSLRR